jgi:hypothetical protein
LKCATCTPNSNCASAGRPAISSSSIASESTSIGMLFPRIVFIQTMLAQQLLQQVIFIPLLGPCVGASRRLGCEHVVLVPGCEHGTPPLQPRREFMVGVRYSTVYAFEGLAVFEVVTTPQDDRRIIWRNSLRAHRACPFDSGGAFYWENALCNRPVRYQQQTLVTVSPARTVSNVLGGHPFCRTYTQCESPRTRQIGKPKRSRTDGHF